MPSKNYIDLKWAQWPICLLESKRVIDDMPRGAVLDIRVQDPDMVVDMVRIIECSNAQIIERQQQVDCCRLTIKKFD